MSTPEVTSVRLALKAAGFSPIPCRGKRPWFDEWQHKLDASEEEMRRWPGRNTGLITANNPAFDIDITDPEPAGAIEELVKDWFSDRGEILVRFGNSPKRALLFRTSQPFPKITVNFMDARGEKQRIEILCNGQQMIAAGTHPDTNKPYRWFDANPWDVGYAALAEVSGEEMQECVELVVAMLKEQFGYVQVQANGRDHAGGTAGPVDVDFELQAMADGKSVNDAQMRVIPSLLRKGEHPDDVLELVVDETMAHVGVRLGWRREEEVKHVRKRILAGYNNLLLKGYELADGVPEWLPGEFHADWLERVALGRRPTMGYNRAGFYVRSYEAEDTGAGDQGTPNGASAPKAPKKGVFVLRPFVPVDPATLPPRQWLYGRHYQRRTVSATVAPGGFGKTTLCMVESVAMATVRNLLGEQPTERLRVWYHNGEDNLEELTRRLVAICLHYGIPQEELQDWFFMTSGNEVPLKVAKGYGDLKIDSHLIKCIEREVERNKIDVAILDPLVTLHGVSEGDNNKMDTVVRIFATIADAQDCSVELAHHTRKLLAGSTADYVVDDMRGASAIKDAVRAARMLNQMTSKDAEEVGIPEHERGYYFRVDRVKGNNAPPSKAVWRRFVSVELPNTDEVGVVEPWDFPGQGEASPQKTDAERTADHVFMELLVRFSLEGRTVSESAGTNYAPHLFSQEPEAKVAKVSKRRLVDAMRRLFAAKRIRVERVVVAGHERHAIVIV